MKFFYSTLIMGLVFSPLCYADCSTESKQAALKFINGYVQYMQQYRPDSNQWVAKHKTLTPSFKTTYKKLIDAALKEDPELGLGFDPILDGQDFADKFDKIKSCNEKSGVMLLSGSWGPDTKERMEVAVKPVNKNGKWLIDGSGVINIPETEQAPR